MDFNKHGGGNKQGVLTFFRRSIDEEKGNVSGGWKKSKINKRVSLFIREMRVKEQSSNS